MKKNLLINNRTKTYGLIFLTAILVRVIGIFVYGIDYSGDSVEYDTIACNITQGHGYSLSQSPPFELTTHREPTYPLFLALIYYIFGHNVPVVIIIQCLLGSLVCVMIYKTTRQVYEDDRVALLAALVNAFYLPIAIFNLRLLSETTATLLVAIIAYNLVQIFSNGKNWINYIALGITTGLLMLNKLAFQLFPFLIVAMIILLPRDKKSVFKSISCLLLIAILIGPWLFFNKKVHGSYALGSSVRVGHNFYVRVANDGMKGPISMRTDLYQDFLKWEKSGIDAGKINEEYISKAIDIIRKHPFRYMAGIFLEIKDLWKFGVRVDEIDVSGKVTVEGIRGKIYLAIKYIFLISNFFILFTGIIGFFMKMNRKSSIVMSIVFYATLIFSLFGCVLPRYNVIVLPLTIIFAAYFIVEIYDRKYGRA